MSDYSNMSNDEFSILYKNVNDEKNRRLREELRSVQKNEDISSLVYAKPEMEETELIAKFRKDFPKEYEAFLAFLAKEGYIKPVKEEEK